MNEFEQPEEELKTSFIHATPPAEEEPGMASKWASASKRWARETGLRYLSNPTARKDFTVQFRGGKSGWLFTIYLAVLGVAAGYEYWHIAAAGSDIAGAQDRLHELYKVILAILGVVVSLVAPALSATAVVAERQRRSLDLVFTAPIKPQTYLIGKIIATYRYVWILLALSLPITAMSVVLGGASWTDVLEAFFMLSVQGVVFTSIGLFFSSMVEKAVSAVLYTYGAVAAYLAGTAYLAALGSLGYYNQGLGFDQGLSFLWALNPFGMYQIIGSSTPIWGIPVPNVFLGAAASALIVRLTLGAAAAHLVPPKPRERLDLRLTMAGVIGATVAYLGYVIAGQPFGIGQGSSQAAAGMLAFWALAPLAIAMPFLSCFGFDGEQRFQPNGKFSLKLKDIGTPAGSLPYILGLVATTSIASFAGFAANHVYAPAVLAYGLFGAAFWSFFWALGRFASSYLGGVKISRTFQFLGFVAVLGIPAALLGMIPEGNMHPVDQFPWVLHLLSQMFSMNPDPGAMALHGVLWLAGAFGLSKMADRVYASRAARRAERKRAQQGNALA